MSNLSRGAGFLERMLEEAARRLSAAGLHPLRLRDDIVTAFDASVRSNDAANDLRVSLNPADFARLGPELDAFRDDMQSVLTARASQRGWSSVAALRLSFVSDRAVQEGSSVVDSRFAHGPGPSAVVTSNPTRRLTPVRDLILVLPGGESVRVRRLPFSIGRMTDNDLVLASMAVSRFHAELVSSPPAIVVRDKGSFNGVVIDGQRVDEAPLVDGTVFAIGDVELTVRFEAPMIAVDELSVLRLALLGLLILFVAVVALSMRSALSPATTAASPLPRTSRRRPLLSVVAPAGSGLAAGASFELAGAMTIGRDPGNGIVVPDPSVSGQHAVIRLDGRTWMLSDLGSTNGTLLDDEPVTAPGRALRGGECITIGAVLFRFQA